ncbi:hypothetical protein NFI96_007632 [Prochilodus magdalenae]|nr:hypothetical protein NFI96_007632 [Prochilodus magdalenae]
MDGSAGLRGLAFSLALTPTRVPHLRGCSRFLQWLVFAVETPSEIVRRYKSILKALPNAKTMTRAFQKHTIDKNTVVFTSEIGELAVAAPEVYEEALAKRPNEETVLAFAKRCDSLRLSDLRIILLGSRYSGKSSAGNTILNREEFELKRTAQCVKRQGEVAGRHITVVEAPGWWINEPVEENTELLKQEIVLSVSLCPPGPHAVLLIIHVDCAFDTNDRSVIEGYLKLLTDTVWSHTIVLFTCGDCLGDTPIEQHIENEGKDLQWLVEKCGNRYHVLNNKNRSDDTQVTELLEKIEEMLAANSGRHFQMDRKILQEVEEKRRAEVERVKKRMMKVIQIVSQS